MFCANSIIRCPVCGLNQQVLAQNAGQNGRYQQANGSYPPAQQYPTPVNVVTNVIPVSPPVRKVSTWRKIVVIFSLLIAILAIAFTGFSVYWASYEGPGPILIAIAVSIFAIILSGIGKGGCHIAGMIISIISLVIGIILFLIFGGLEALSSGRLDSITRFFNGDLFQITINQLQLKHIIKNPDQDQFPARCIFIFAFHLPPESPSFQLGHAGFYHAVLGRSRRRKRTDPTNVST